MCIYPDNLAAKATLWLWELKDLAIIGIGFLIGIFSLVRTGALLPLALVVAYGFLSIRFDNTSILDFIRYAAAYFFTRQQYFEWNNSFKNGCVSSSEKELLNFSYPTLTAEDGHTGESSAGVCLTEIKPPSTGSRLMRVFGAGWSGSAATTASTFWQSISEV